MAAEPCPERRHPPVPAGRRFVERRPQDEIDARAADVAEVAQNRGAPSRVGFRQPDALSDAVRRTRALNTAADSQARWSTILLVGGAVAAVTSVVWYVALPPKGKWRWAATPAGIQATVRF